MAALNADTNIIQNSWHRVPRPPSPGYLDQVTYRSVHFYGAKLADPLAEAARYLRQVEKQDEKPPHVLCVHEQFSLEDYGSDLAWQVTLVLGEQTEEMA